MADRIRRLEQHLHVNIRGCGWEPLYVSSRDGYSLGTLIDKARGRAPVVLLVRDGEGHVFGAFLQQGL
eukprot:CAMPEP_0172198168 /NCGR_PEP_ID=MMETSP1050-20130122/27924_1 /TAXON_ID=233186 /ORGANISM="Cryptomonas curvata, Strain CCAP979/52" /LENGTH=67 /DNA_ID=CAMNT_0012874933 /DNA_START=1 /DNA_END=200 /DNA_ORIENTATION=-